MLSKWYMDCVSDAGDVFIGYAATLRWKALSINYSSVLEHRFGEPLEARTSLLKFSPLEISGSSLAWSSDSLGVTASWKAIASPIEQTIFESDMGSIIWRCIAPIADAEVRTQNQPCLKGLGYAEHITLTIPPWQLPIDELRWGRFLSDSDHLIWIGWRGTHPLTLVYHNGIAIDGSQVTDNEISFADGRLTISRNDRRVLREGALISTALAMIPGIKKLIPRRILDGHESKWCSKGVMKKPDAMDLNGWVIHEVVRWGR